MKAAHVFRSCSVFALALAITVAFGLPAFASVSLDDHANSSLTVAPAATSQLTLNSQLGVSASVSSASSAPVGQGPYAAYASPASASGGNAKTASGDGSGVPIHYVPGPGPIAGDVNGDGKVDFSDFMIIQAHFGQHVSSRSEGDLNGDGVVDFSDFMILQAHFGDELVPEPMSLAIWAGMIGLVGLVYHIRRR